MAPAEAKYSLTNPNFPSNPPSAPSRRGVPDDAPFNGPDRTPPGHNAFLEREDLDNERPILEKIIARAPGTTRAGRRRSAKAAPLRGESPLVRKAAEGGGRSGGVI